MDLPNKKASRCEAFLFGAPTRIRTWDPRLRRPLLYPAELWARILLRIDASVERASIINRRCRPGATLYFLISPTFGVVPRRSHAAKRCFGRSNPAELWARILLRIDASVERASIINRCCHPGATLCFLISPTFGVVPRRSRAAKRCFGRSNPTELWALKR